MPPPVYTIHIAGYTVAAGGSNSQGPPPAGFQWVVVDISAMLDCTASTGDLEAVFTIALQPFIDWWCAPFTRRTAHWSGRQVVDGGSALAVTCPLHTGSTGVIRAEVTGYLLSLP